MLRSIPKDPPLTKEPEMLQMSLLGLVFTWLRRPIEIKFQPDWKLAEVPNQGCNPLEADFFVIRFF